MSRPFAIVVVAILAGLGWWAWYELIRSPYLSHGFMTLEMQFRLPAGMPLPPDPAAVRITVRALDRGLTGIAKLVAGGLLLAWRRDRALRQWRKGCASLCFAAGCITPIAGVRSYPYRKIQGA